MCDELMFYTQVMAQLEQQESAENRTRTDIRETDKPKTQQETENGINPIR